MSKRMGKVIRMAEKSAFKEKLSHLKEKLSTFFGAYGFAFDLAISIFFLVVSVWSLVNYITGPALAYFHSDCADSLIWAQASIESGKVLSEDFAYAALLPFGSNLWMIPIIKLFGFTMKAQTLSMIVFAVIFVLSALAMFRSMKWRWSLSSAAVFCLSMMLSASVKLREIMWEHVIYYSLGILFVMLLLTLVFRLSDKLHGFFGGSVTDKIKAGVYALLLGALCAGCATDGLQILVISVIPVAIAVAAYLIFDSDTKLLSGSAGRSYALLGIIAVGTLIGFLVLNSITNGGEISAGYEDAYSSWSSVNKWQDNAKLFVSHYFSLAGVDIKDGTSLMATESITALVRTFGALVVLVCPFVLLFSYNRLRDRYSKIVALTHLAIFAVIIFTFVCGRLSNANWRLTPLFGSSVIATLVYIKHLLGGGVTFRRVGAILAAFLVCVSVVNNTVMSDLKDKDAGKEPLAAVAELLVEKGYDRGYATFWNAAETALRSDGKVAIINVDLQNREVLKRHYQTMKYWFDDVEGQEEYFLLLTEQEYTSLYDSPYWIELTSRVSITDTLTCNDYYIIVFDDNIF